MHKAECAYVQGNTHCDCGSDDPAFSWSLADIGVRLKFHRSVLMRPYVKEDLARELVEQEKMMGLAT